MLLPLLKKAKEQSPRFLLTPNLTSAVESQFFIFWAGKSYRFNKSLRNGENSDEYE
jgi:hypothetical protein